MTQADLSRGATVAAAIADAWSREGGPGGAIVLFDGQGPRGMAAGGFASLEHRIAFTPAMPSRWASISKQFCAATALLAGFDLASPLGALVPDLPESLAAVPLEHALGMTGALPDVMETLWLLGLPYTASLSESELLALCRRLPGTGGPPGVEMAYSNTGWRLVSAAFAAGRAESYGQALHRLLLEPLGLGDVAFPEDEATSVPGLATPYWHDGNNWRRGRYGMHFSPSGGLAGSAEALARWGTALLAGQGPAASMLTRLSAPRPFPDSAENFYRLGLSTLDLDGLALVGHGGSLPGVKTHILMAPSLGCGVALISNREDTDPLWLALRVMAAISGRALPQPASLPPGLYAEEGSEAWAEVEGETISFMGVGDRLFTDGAGGVRTLPAYLQATLHAMPDGAIEGRVGGVVRRLLPVPEATALDPALRGRWQNDAFGLSLEVRADGTALLPGIHPRDTCMLRPLPNGRAVADRRHGPWRARPLLWLQPDGSLRLVSHRSRVLVFRRG
ncbi:serine hydrolase domain-containing protein [Roseomonas xinghualingensis]|uniref:serine hydrolase domain-containing protein n=1 Tax=Roseomonas xinghualingensis TaxID=2986475 RepID=UPI0021F1682A|nr:serine hydrolase domain-containing protein [Roseomonas sp. SXEYE001]MCV4206225.1 beta-lactamase family protein [Roseomonas sp. SXEYE001]